MTDLEFKFLLVDSDLGIAQTTLGSRFFSSHSSGAATLAPTKSTSNLKAEPGTDN
jgi:hypothetical protein